MATVTVTSNVHDVTERLKNKMLEVQELGGKTMEEICLKNTKELAYQLYKAAADSAPTEASIRALPQQLKNHIKRKFGVTIAQEINKRVKARKLTARAWLVIKKKLGNSRTNFATQNASVRFTKNPSSGGFKIIVELINKHEWSSGFDDRNNVVNRALEGTNANMQVYIDRKREEIKRLIRS